MRRLIAAAAAVILVFSGFAAYADSNALARALAYLNTAAFSKAGLIEQLEYEGFTHSEARAAADMCGADWKKQALLKAKQYLEVSAFSSNGLIEQLEFDGFTHEEAAYGVSNCGADWFHQSVEKARQYLDLFSFSSSELIEQLEFDGFTHDQAVYGAQYHGYSAAPDDNADAGAHAGIAVSFTESEYVSFLNSAVSETFGEGPDKGDESLGRALDRLRLEYLTEIDTGVGKASAYACDYGNVLFVENTDGSVNRLTFVCDLSASDIKSKDGLTPEQQLNYNFIELFVLTALDSFNANSDRDELREAKDAFLGHLTSYCLYGYEFKNCEMYYIISERPAYQITLKH